MATVRTNSQFKRQMNTPAAAKQWQEQTARLGRTTIQSLAPADTGYLKEKITANPSTSEAKVRFRASTGRVPYGLYQEVGTGIYGPLGRYITPKRARMLSWVDKATRSRVFANRVRGVRPSHYFKRSLEFLFGSSNVRYYGEQGGKPPAKG